MINMKILHQQAGKTSLCHCKAHSVFLWHCILKYHQSHQNVRPDWNALQTIWFVHLIWKRQMKRDISNYDSLRFLLSDRIYLWALALDRAHLYLCPPLPGGPSSCVVAILEDLHHFVYDRLARGFCTCIYTNINIVWIWSSWTRICVVVYFVYFVCRPHVFPKKKWIQTKEDTLSFLHCPN